MDSYIPYVLPQAEVIKDAERTSKLCSYKVEHSSYQYNPTHHNTDNRVPRPRSFDPLSGSWSCVDLKHPATFETIAVEPEIKRMIIDDLDKFVKRREFYKRVGKAWKRGYLLYGPPGIGKSSLVAAMVNHIRFDIHDLEFTSIRKALMSTTNRSIVVFEDIDCSKESVNRESAESNNMVSDTQSKFTLSGLLNVFDGLGSSSGDERIIVFTTNHKDRLDPALLRPGRMDVHTHMSYCTPTGFRVLASNYLGIHGSKPHHLCGEIEGLIASTDVTTAEVAEELMKSDDADVTLKGLVNFLKKKKVENDKMKDEGVEKTTDQEPENEPFPNDYLHDYDGLFD